VKAKPGKVTVSSKAKSVTAKAKPASKATAKPTAKAKPVVKAKPAAKPAAKAAVKTAKPGAKKPAAKPVIKTVAKKAAAKPVPKVAAKKVAAKKVAAKPVVKAKPASKAAAKPTAKAKPVVKAKVAKPVAKAASKPVKPVAKAAQPSPKAAKPVVASAKPAVKAVAPTKPVSAVVARPSAPAVPVAAPQAAPVAKRVSSRLAQLTVPSMAQSVASTAAKSSFLQTMSTTQIAPPLPTAIKKDPKLANNWKTKSAEELTDAELLAMPDSEYMNDKQLAAFRLRLSNLKQDILNNAGETTEHLREDTVVVPDPADRATIEEEHALELRTRDRERKLLKKIEQSIARIDAGDYGYCDETGESIGVGRLLARPTATLSLEAQQRRELKQKMFGD